jgi:hypothetical protein
LHFKRAASKDAPSSIALQGGLHLRMRPPRLHFKRAASKDAPSSIALQVCITSRLRKLLQELCGILKVKGIEAFAEPVV